MLSIHQIVFTKIFSFLFLPSNLFKSRCQIKESLYGLRIHGRYHIHITVHMTLFSVLPEELDSVGGGVEPGRQGLGAVPSAHPCLITTSQLCASIQLLALAHLEYKNEMFLLMISKNVILSSTCEKQH